MNDGKDYDDAKELAAQIKFRARIAEDIRPPFPIAPGRLDPAHRDELVAKAREWAKDILPKRR